MYDSTLEFFSLDSSLIRIYLERRFTRRNERVGGNLMVELPLKAAALELVICEIISWSR